MLRLYSEPASRMTTLRKSTTAAEIRQRIYDFRPFSSKACEIHAGSRFKHRQEVGGNMNGTKTYIVEISQVLGDETSMYLETDGNAVKSLFASVEISDGGASIVDNVIARSAKRRVHGRTQSRRKRTI